MGLEKPADKNPQVISLGISPSAPKGWAEMECGGQRQKQGLSEE